MNLRAALLRQLTDLKKDGLLGPTIVLRKTMLDECKGDKFEELLAAFALIVLKKITASTDRPFDPTRVKRENLVPLVLSYRKGIQRDLEERKELGLRARQQLRNINASIEVFSTEAEKLRHQKPPEIPENADLLRTLLRENWIGDYAWVDTILNGTPPALSVPDQAIVEEHVDDDSSKLLIDLELKVRSHNDRLKQWQTYLEDLQQGHQTKPTLNEQEKKKKQEQVITSRFTRHLNPQSEGSARQTSAKSGKLNTQHAALLESLDRGMNFTTPKHISKAKPVPVVISAGFEVNDEEATPRASRFDRSVRRAGSTSSDRLSQSSLHRGTNMSRVTEDSEALQTSKAQQNKSTTPPQPLTDSSWVERTSEDAHNHSLLERTRASLAQFETPKARVRRGRDPVSVPQHKQENTITVMSSQLHSDRTSLLERTRQSMSMLTNVLDDDHLNRRRSGPKKPTHSRSKTVNLPSQRPRLERAWSEESLASAATKEESIDLEADYESVFKSRPRLAMSPNLSPQRAGGDLWLDAQLEQSMNKLTINSSPDDSRL